VVRLGQAGGSEILLIENRVVSGTVGPGLDIEHERNPIVDPGHSDIDSHVPESIEKRSRARRLRSFDPQVPALSSVWPMSRWRDDPEALPQVGDRRAVVVMDSLVEHQRARCWAINASHRR
jgi:hypothetical protein